MAALENFVGEWIGTFFRDFAGKIHSINQRYATPKIRLSGWAKLALLLLEIYLIVLVGLLAYRFWTIVNGGA
jgi:hypothetical protein